MASTGSYTVKIAAVDNASKVLRDINARIAGMQAPFKNLQKQFSKFMDISGLNKIKSAFSELGAKIGGVGKTLLNAFEPLAAITSVASVAGLYKLVSSFAALGTELLNVSSRLGISVTALQSFRNAARLAGASAGAMDASIEGLGNKAQDALAGRDPEALRLFQRFGIRIRDHGLVARSGADMLGDAFDAIKRIHDNGASASTTSRAMGQLGIDPSLYRFAIQGAAGLAKYNAEAAKYGLMNKSGADAADKLRESQTRVQMAVEGLGYSLSEKLASTLGPLLDQFANWLATSPQIQSAMQDFADWIKAIDWQALVANIKSSWHELNSIVQAFGGWKAVAKDVIELKLASWALGLISPFASLGVGLWNVARAMKAIRLASEVEGAGKLLQLGGKGIGALGAAVGAAAAVAPALLVGGDVPKDERGFSRDSPQYQANLKAARAAGGQTPGEWWNSHAPKWMGGHTFSRDITPEARGLLDTIAGTESPGYNVMYGGKTFSDYSHHPDVAVPITRGPNAGLTSTAAGRYQFLKSTWDDASKALGLKDFSPENQDKAAYWLAQRDYYKKSGRDLAADLKSNDPAIKSGIGNALHSTWTSLPGGIEAGTNTSKFAQQLDANTAKEGQGASQTADANTQPQLLGRLEIDHKNVPANVSTKLHTFGDGLAVNLTSTPMTGLP